MSELAKPSELGRVDRLTIDRELLERAMLTAGPKELPSLVREHRAVLAEIEKLAKPAKGSIRDQVADKRAQRQAGSSGSPAAEA